MDQLDLVELVLADQAAHILAVGAGLGAEAGGVGGVAQRQVGLVEDLAAVQVGQRYLGGRHQVVGYLLSRELGDRHEVAMLSLWDSLSSIREFAGDPPDRANYDEYLRLGHDYLIDLPDRVDHFDVLEVENLDTQSPGEESGS